MKFFCLDFLYPMSCKNCNDGMLVNLFFNSFPPFFKNGVECFYRSFMLQYYNYGIIKIYSFDSTNRNFLSERCCISGISELFSIAGGILEKCQWRKPG